MNNRVRRNRCKGSVRVANRVLVLEPGQAAIVVIVAAVTGHAQSGQASVVRALRRHGMARHLTGGRSIKGNPGQEGGQNQDCANDGDDSSHDLI